MNRLARERSPYLLQHANNPVDWYPWGDEAFAKARAEDKPIFLSIGYSTCHWCHVMEHESFENDAVAARAQRALRVDQGRSRGAAGRRSRLHDVRAGDDRIRRLADERLADAGPEAVLRRHLLSADVAVGPARASSTSCRRSRASGATSATKVRAVGGGDDRRSCAGDRSGRAGWTRARRRRARAHGRRSFAQAFDARHGGFGDAPKFPRPSELLFLLREHARTGDADAARHGAARRCARWRSAACAITSAAAFIATRSTPPGACRTSRRCCTTRRSSCSPTSRPRRRPAIRSTPRSPRTRCSYVMREMTDADGGFYSAEDADSVPPEQAGEPHAHKIGRRVLPLARRRDRRAARRRRADRQAALRHRAGRQRAARSAAGVHRQEPAVRRASRSTRSPTRPGEPADEVVEVLQPRAADDVRGAAATGRGRSSTTRC